VTPGGVLITPFNLISLGVCVFFLVGRGFWCVGFSFFVGCVLTRLVKWVFLCMGIVFGTFCLFARLVFILICLLFGFCGLGFLHVCGVFCCSFGCVICVGGFLVCFFGCVDLSFDYFFFSFCLWWYLFSVFLGGFFDFDL
jgi:hypothetical protein